MQGRLDAVSDDGSKLKGTHSADFHYYNWVDQHNTGFGADTPSRPDQPDARSR